MAGYRKRAANADAVEFGARLMEAQDASGVTNAEIAKATGAPLNTVSKWRKGVQLPNARAVSAIAHAVGRSEHWLLTGKHRDGKMILEGGPTGYEKLNPIRRRVAEPNVNADDEELLHALRLAESLIKKRIQRLYGRS